MGQIVYRCQHQRQKQKQKTIKISRIASLIEPKYRGLSPTLKLCAKTWLVLGQLALCNTGLEFTSIKHRANSNDYSQYDYSQYVTSKTTLTHLKLKMYKTNQSGIFSTKGNTSNFWSLFRDFNGILRQRCSALPTEL